MIETLNKHTENPTIHKSVLFTCLAITNKKIFRILLKETKMVLYISPEVDVCALVIQIGAVFIVFTMAEL